jgi:CRP-like cAMP-binding protein
VCARLAELAGRFGRTCDDGIRIDLPLAQHDLAAWTGASLESVTRALQLLRRLRAVRTGRMNLTVLDADLIQRYAAGLGIVAGGRAAAAA